MAKQHKKRKMVHGKVVPAVSGFQEFHLWSISQTLFSAKGISLLLPVATIVVAAMTIFWPVLRGGWLWDDNVDITENPITQSAGGLRSIWFEPGTQPDYYPVKASVQWAQWHLFGSHTLGYHVTNLVLHIVSALLVWRLFHQLGLKLAWLGGLIFAIHPALVESVAWIAELKNTLAMPFFLLSAIFYLKYDQHRRRTDHFFSLGLFLMAMLTKPSMVMWPVALLLYAWWRRGRIGSNDLKASAPFFVISLLLGVATLAMASWYKYLHHQGADAIPLGGFFSRMALMGLTLAFYFGKAVWPAGLLPVYPQWPVNPPSLREFLPWPVLGGLLFWFWTKRQSWGRDVLLGLGFFLLMLAPFSGIMPASFMFVTWVMDHFLYIPILGLIGLVIAGLDQAARWMPQPARYGGIGLVAMMLGAMIMESRSYAKNFASEETLWTYTLAHDPGCWEAHDNLGIALFQKGEVDEAIGHFQKALGINPDYAKARNNLGNALAQKGQIDDALAQFQKAVAIDSSFAQAHYNFGNALVQKGQMDEAMEEYKKALELSPGYAEAHYNFGLVLLMKGRLDEAIAQFQEAVGINPNYTDAHNNLGVAFVREGRLDAAIQQFRQVLQLDPGNREAQNNLARAQTAFVK